MQAFSEAIVQVELPAGVAILHPSAVPGGDRFPFDAPIHIVTAYNPDGIEIARNMNTSADQQLGDALRGYTTFRTIGSAVDGTFAEPGFGIVNCELDDALALGHRFGQVAIYRWCAESLAICEVSSGNELHQQWRLEWS